MYRWCKLLVKRSWITMLPFVNVMRRSKAWLLGFGRLGLACCGVIFLAAPGSFSGGELLGPFYYLYQGHPLGININTYRDLNSSDGHLGDWIALTDRSTGEVKVVNPKITREEIFRFWIRDYKVVFDYKLSLVEHTSHDGIRRTWVQVTGDGGKLIMDSKGAATQFTIDALQERRRKLAVSINERFRIGASEYYVVPQFGICGCFQFMEIKADNTVGDMVGL